MARDRARGRDDVRRALLGRAQRRAARVPWITPGGVLAVVVWLVASAAFALFVANFGSYNATYGALAGVVVFLVWLWLTNVAILLGAELNAELERQRELESAFPGSARSRSTIATRRSGEPSAGVERFDFVGVLVGDDVSLHLHRGVSSPPSWEKSRGSTSNFFTCSTRANF